MCGMELAGGSGLLAVRVPHSAKAGTNHQDFTILPWGKS